MMYAADEIYGDDDVGIVEPEMCDWCWDWSHNLDPDPCPIHGDGKSDAEPGTEA